MLHQKIVESPFRQKYGNFIGGEWREPVAGRYFDNTTPVTGGVLCQVARSDAAACWVGCWLRFFGKKVHADANLD